MYWMWLFFVSVPCTKVLFLTIHFYCSYHINMKSMITSVLNTPLLLGSVCFTNLICKTRLMTILYTLNSSSNWNVVSPFQPWCNPLWLTGLRAPTKSNFKSLSYLIRSPAASHVWTLVTCTSLTLASGLFSGMARAATKMNGSRWVLD